MARQALRDEHDMSALFAMPGWDLIRAFIEDELHKHIEDLIKETDHQKFLKTQANILALRIIPTVIKNVLENADQASKLLKDYKDIPQI